MTTDTTTTPAPTGTTQPHPCDVCPLRSTAEDVRRDYCEGCPHVERWCPGCRRHKPQVGWWWGIDMGHIDWMCADCRFAPPDAETLARFPERATHPALEETAARHPRFTTRLELDGPGRRFQAAQALSRAASVLPLDPAGAVLGRMAAALQTADFDGRLEVDVSQVDMLSRLYVARALDAATGSSHTASAVLEPLGRLARSWARWVDEQLPRPPLPPTEAEREERERVAMRRGRERVVGDG
jgi:hypothetical protein